MLVLLKADTMVRAEAEAAAEELAEEMPWEDDAIGEAPLPRNLERHLHRRAVAVPPKRRKVTLEELIQQLETMATVMAEQVPPVKGQTSPTPAPPPGRTRHCPTGPPGEPLRNCRRPGVLPGPVLGRTYRSGPLDGF